MQSHRGETASTRQTGSGVTLAKALENSECAMQLQKASHMPGTYEEFHLSGCLEV